MKQRFNFVIGSMSKCGVREKIRTHHWMMRVIQHSERKRKWTCASPFVNKVFDFKRKSLEISQCPNESGKRYFLLYRCRFQPYASCLTSSFSIYFNSHHTYAQAHTYTIPLRSINLLHCLIVFEWKKTFLKSTQDEILS